MKSPLIDHRIWIIGSGPSAKKADFSLMKPEDVVFGVNGTVEWAPRLDWWFTLDQSPLNLERLKNPRKGVLYFAALPNQVGLPDGIVRYSRIAIGGRSGNPKSSEPRPRRTPEWWMWRWSATKTLSEKVGAIHTGNSMWGALQIAYQFGYREIILVGLDGTKHKRIEGGRPNNFAHLPMLFESALPQLNESGIKVINANPHSAVTCFPRVNFNQAVAV